MFRIILAILVFGLAFCIVVFAVLMGFVFVADALGDQPTSTVLRWVAGGLLVVATTDLLLLVLALGWRAMADGGAEPPRDE
jgi:hypothetical protein